LKKCSIVYRPLVRVPPLKLTWWRQVLELRSVSTKLKFYSVIRSISLTINRFCIRVDRIYFRSEEISIYNIFSTNFLDALHKARGI
jgi:hypothetical protein